MKVVGFPAKQAEDARQHIPHAVQDPPQSTLVSSPFCAVSLQAPVQQSYMTY